MSGVIITDLVNTRSVNGTPEGNPKNGAWIYFDVISKNLKAKFYDGSVVTLGSFKPGNVVAGTGISVNHNSNGTVTINNTAQNDDLGDHTATQDLSLEAFSLTGTDGITFEAVGASSAASVYSLMGRYTHATTTNYPAELRFYASNDDPNNTTSSALKYIGIRGATVTANYDIVLPNNQPATTGTVLSVSNLDGNVATLSWTASGSGSTTLVGLTDTPASFGTAGQVLAVNSSANGAEWVTATSVSAGNQYDIQIANASNGFTNAPWQINIDGHLIPVAADASDGFGSATNPVAYAWLGKGGVYFHKDNSTPAMGEYAQIATDGTNGDLIFTAISHNNGTNYEFKAIDNHPAKLIIESGSTNQNFSLYAHPSPTGNQVFKLPPAIGRNHTALLTTSVSGTDGELGWKCVTNTFGATYGYVTFPFAPSGALSGTGNQPQAHIVASASRFSLPTASYIWSVVDNTDGNDHCKVTFNFDFNFRAFDGDYSINAADLPNGSNYTIKVHFVAASDAANIETLGYAAASLPTGSASIASFSFNPSANVHRFHGQVSFSANNTRMTYLSSEVRHGSSGLLTTPEASSPLTVEKFSNADADTLRDIAIIWEIGTTEASPALTAFTTGTDFILVERSGGFS